MWLSILIRDKDDYLNVNMLVQDINEKESIIKQLRKILQSPQFAILEYDIMSQGAVLKIGTILHYVLLSVLCDICGIFMFIRSYYQSLVSKLQSNISE
jgi:hypothetical protein